MKLKYGFALILACMVILTACKRDSDTSTFNNLTGVWKLTDTYNISIAGLKHEKVNSGLTLQFWGSNQYTERNYDTVKLSASYSIIENYRFAANYTANALKINNVFKGTYQIKAGTQDTLLISSPESGIDYGFSSGYIRVK